MAQAQEHAGHVGEPGSRRSGSRRWQEGDGGAARAWWCSKERTSWRPNAVDVGGSLEGVLSVVDGRKQCQSCALVAGVVQACPSLM